ncbi:MAG: beta-galactosidase [Eubacteriales bacterium]|nr:beta-galactosidase [Eubacteriales bacterium]
MSEQLIYGTAYYYEYLPMDRMEEDFRMMTKAGFNTIRIAESTWSTWEPQDGVFDFTYLHRVLKAAGNHGLSVIVGTPTYAIPSWLAKKYPDILSDTHSGRCRYGARQNFDMTHPGYRFHAERIIRRLLEEVKGYDCVIGFQLDNETKPYDTCSEYAQKLFKEHLIEQYGTTDALNDKMGLAYWSNSIADWDDLPDVRGTINASFGGEYEAFQRSIVTEFLSWQRNILEEYRQPDQFVTHNFDFEWRLYSYGFQPEAEQFEASKALTIAGCDIYHPSEHALTGAEISFCGANAYGLKKSNYLVLETEAQGNFGWLPYPGQLRLQAFAQLASGAEGISYWHWHSIHNAVESYWKGVLSHDFSEGAVYQEAATIGKDFQRLSGKLIHLKKKNRIAIMVSSRSQTGLRWFPTAQQGAKPDHDYNDYLRWICDTCYRMNAEYDILNDTERDFSKYDVLILPVLYAAEEELIEAVRRYVENGGKIITTFKSFFADPVLKIYHDTQPHGLTKCLGVHYDRFTRPVDVELKSSVISLPEHCAVTDWMELLEDPDAEVLCTYDHPAWGGIPAVTRNTYGNGQAVYLGCCFDAAGLEAVLACLFREWGVFLPDSHYPLIIKKGISREGKLITYYLNFSREEQKFRSPCEGTELLQEESVSRDQELVLPPWGVKILETDI